MRLGCLRIFVPSPDKARVAAACAAWCRPCRGARPARRSWPCSRPWRWRAHHAAGLDLSGLRMVRALTFGTSLRVAHPPAGANLWPRCLRHQQRYSTRLCSGTRFRHNARASAPARASARHTTGRGQLVTPGAFQEWQQPCAPCNMVAKTPSAKLRSWLEARRSSAGLQQQPGFCTSWSWP